MAISYLVAANAVAAPPSAIVTGETRQARVTATMSEIVAPLAASATGVGRGADGQADWGGMPVDGAPGAPALPVTTVRWLLPPDADMASVQVSISNPKEVSLGVGWDVSPAPPPAANGVAVWPVAATIVDGRNTAIYARDAFHPANPITFTSTGKSREWRVVEASVSPFRFNPVTGELLRLESADLVVRFETLQALGAASAVDHPTLREQSLGRLGQIANAVDAGLFASLAINGDGPVPLTTTYVIMTTSGIAAQSTTLAAFRALKESAGFSVVQVVEGASEDATHYLTGGTCAQRAANMRNWLKSRYLSLGVQYVLLVGNPDPTTFTSASSVPMLMCYPRRGAGDGDEQAPTDTCYAELSGTWDLDADGYPGEYADVGTGGADKYDEVAVGRIPVYDTGSTQIGHLDSILAKTIAYETSSDRAWRKNLLGTGSYSDASTDGAYLIEYLRTEVCDPAGYDTTTLYQQGSRSSSCNSTFASDHELRGMGYGGDLNHHHYHWQTADYGVSIWWGHGSDSSTSVGYEGVWDGSVFESSTASGLDNAHPSFLFASSCNNGYPETVNNLGVSVLRNGGIGVLSASRVSWYAVTAWHSGLLGSCSDNASFNGYLVRRMVTEGETIGEGRAWVRANGGISSWQGSSWMNHLDFNIYGDPAQALDPQTSSTPAIPSGLNATDGTYPNKVAVSWNPASGASHYRVSRAIGAAGSKTDLGAWQTGTSYDDTTATPDVLYHYWVRSATNDVGSGVTDYSLPDTGFCAVPPVAPTGVDATDGTFSNRVQVTWGAVSGAASYRVYRNTSSSTNGAALLGSTDATSYDDTTAQLSVKYYYWVTAVGATGLESPFGGPDSGYRRGPLPAPEDVTASEGTYTNRIAVQWSALAGASHYRVLRSDAPGGITVAGSGWIAGTSWDDVDPSLTPGRSYWYALQAALDSTGSGVGPSSAQVEGWLKLSPPTTVNASDGIYSVKIAVSWSPVAGATRYRLHRATSADQSDRAAVSGWINATSFDDGPGGLAQGVTYYYTVQASVDASGGRPSDYSAADPGTLGDPLAAPTGVTAWDGVSTAKVNVAWSAVSGASHYRLFRATATNGALSAVSGWTNSLACDDATGTPGRSYYYAVKAATDAAGSRESLPSAVDEGWRTLLPSTGIAASDTFTDRVRVTWTASSGASHHRVLRGTTPGGSKSSVSDWLSATTFDDTNVLFGVGYYYAVVSAVDATGARPSAQSAEDAGWRAVLPPASVQASDGTSTNWVFVTWPPVPDAQFYRVYRATSSSGTKTAIGGWQTTTNLTDAGATPGVTYYYWVQSATDANGTGSGLFSPYDDGWRGLSAPVLWASDDTFSDKVYIAWTKVDGASYYRVARSDSPTGVWADLGSWTTATNYSDTLASPGTGYWYTVRGAINNTGGRVGIASEPDAGRRSLPPPGNLVATDGTLTDRVAVTWSASSNATHYCVHRGITAGGPKVPISGWQTATAYDDFAAVPGVTYYYAVQPALDATGLQAGALSVENDGWRALLPPVPVVATDDTLTNGVAVTWGASYGATHYQVYRTATPGATTRTTLSAWIGETNYLDASASPGVRYYYTVRAAVSVAGLRASAYSAEDEGRRALAAPGGVSATDGTFADKVQVAWVAATGATHYRVWRGDGLSGNNLLPLTGWVTGTSYADGGATPGVDYLYAVQASSDSVGTLTSPLSLKDPGWRGLSAPSWVAAADGERPLRVAWNAVQGATHYRLYRNTSSSTSTRQPVGQWQTGLSYDDSEATPGATYYYWVQAAVDATGLRPGAFSAFNDGWMAFCAPSLVVVSQGTFADKVSVLWNASAGATHYKVYRSTSMHGWPYEVSGWQTSTNFVDTTAEPGVTYWYCVQPAASSSGLRAGPFSDVESGWRALTAPAVVQASKGSLPDVVRVEWSGVAGGVAYRVWRGSTVGAVDTVLGDWAPDPWFNDATAVPGRSYFYAVEAAADGLGAFATGPGAVDEGWRALAGVPWTLASDGVHTNFVRVQWGAVTGAGFHRVYRATLSGGAATAVSGWLAGSSFDDETALPGVEYYYTVQAAIDVAGAHAGPMGAEDVGWRPLVTVVTGGFAEWAATRGLTGDIAVVFAADRNGDGVPNGIEYALGVNWSPADPLLSVVLVDGLLTLETVGQDPATLGDAVVSVEATHSLEPAQWNVPMVRTQVIPSTGREQWRTTEQTDLVFFRLHAQLLP